MTKKFINCAMLLLAAISAITAQAQNNDSKDAERIEIVKEGEFKPALFSLKQNETKKFVVEMNKGQEMLVNFSDPAKDGVPVSLTDGITINARDQHSAKAQVDLRQIAFRSALVEWDVANDTKQLFNNSQLVNQTIPADGDYFVTVKCVKFKECNFRLTVSIPAPVDNGP